MHRNKTVMHAVNPAIAVRRRGRRRPNRWGTKQRRTTPFVAVSPPVCEGTGSEALRRRRTKTTEDAAAHYTRIAQISLVISKYARYRPRGAEMSERFGAMRRIEYSAYAHACGLNSMIRPATLC